MRRAIVTGADGFLGRHLVRALGQQGVAVTALARQSRPGTTQVAMGDAPWPSSRIASIVAAVEPDVVFHMAGAALGSAAELERANAGLSGSVMQGLREAGARPLLICCGSAAEYGSAIVDGVPVREADPCRPAGPYGAAKLRQTQAALAFAEATGTPVLVARIFNPIGPGMPPHLALADFALQIARMPGRGVLHTGNIAVRRDFIDVEHVAGSLCALARNPSARGIVNVCSGTATSLAGLLDLLIAVSGHDVVVEPAPGRMRGREPAVIVGSTERLRALGAAPPRTEFGDVIGRIWRYAEQCRAVA